MPVPLHPVLHAEGVEQWRWQSPSRAGASCTPSSHVEGRASGRDRHEGARQREMQQTAGSGLANGIDERQKRNGIMAKG